MNTQSSSLSHHSCFTDNLNAIVAVSNSDIAEAWANYVQAIDAISGVVKHDERVATGKYAYTYTSHEAIVASTRAGLLKRGVAIVMLGMRPVSTDVVTLASGQTSVLVTIETLWAVVSLGVKLYTFNVISQAMDNTDKGYPKALTVAHRLALRVACYLGTTDDPERYDNGDSITALKGETAKPSVAQDSGRQVVPPKTRADDAAESQERAAGDETDSIDVDGEAARFLKALETVKSFPEAIALFNALPPSVKRVVQPQFAEAISKRRGK